MPNQITYPDKVVGVHYRLSNDGYYITVSFVLPKNIINPELGFNFSRTSGQAVMHSSQLCFLTKEDAEKFSNKYLNGKYQSFISKSISYDLVRINTGGDIPCYATAQCCDFYKNRISDDIKNRLKKAAVSNPFAEDNIDPKIKKKLDAQKEKERFWNLQDDIISQTISDLKELGIEKLNDVRKNSDHDYYRIPLNLDPNKWASIVNYEKIPELDNKPSLILCISTINTGANKTKEISIQDTVLEYIPLTNAYMNLPKNGYVGNRPTYWKKLIAYLENKIRKYPIDLYTYSYIGIKMLQDSAYFYIPFEWTPGKDAGCSDEIVEDIEKIIPKVEAGARAFEQAIEEYLNENPIDTEPTNPWEKYGNIIPLRPRDEIRIRILKKYLNTQPEESKPNSFIGVLRSSHEIDKDDDTLRLDNWIVGDNNVLYDVIYNWKTHKNEVETITLDDLKEDLKEDTGKEEYCEVSVDMSEASQTDLCWEDMVDDFIKYSLAFIAQDDSKGKYKCLVKGFLTNVKKWVAQLEKEGLSSIEWENDPDYIEYHWDVKEEKEQKTETFNIQFSVNFVDEDDFNLEFTLYSEYNGEFGPYDFSSLEEFEDTFKYELRRFDIKEWPKDKYNILVDKIKKVYDKVSKLDRETDDEVEACYEYAEEVCEELNNENFFFITILDESLDNKNNNKNLNENLNKPTKAISIQEALRILSK